MPEQHDGSRHKHRRDAFLEAKAAVGNAHYSLDQLSLIDDLKRKLSSMADTEERLMAIAEGQAVPPDMEMPKSHQVPEVKEVTPEPRDGTAGLVDAPREKKESSAERFGKVLEQTEFSDTFVVLTKEIHSILDRLDDLEDRMKSKTEPELVMEDHAKKPV